MDEDVSAGRRVDDTCAAAVMMTMLVLVLMVVVYPCMTGGEGGDVACMFGGEVSTQGDTALALPM